MPTLDQITKQALRALIPPPRLRLSEWIEREIVLPDGVSALPGPVRLWPFQREIADAIGDAEIERVTLVKPVRVGFTTLLTSALASFVANEPAPILCLLPAEADCRDYMVSDTQSDARIYEVPCPECGAMSELLWPDIVWDAGAPETARWRCPHCAAEVSERHKPEMVAAGAWRATRPEVRGHAGFRMNALISLHTNAAWGKLAAEFVQAKDDPTTLQTFVNTILGQGWRSEGDELAEDELMARAEPFGLSAVPAEVLAVTVGVDVQHDRLEVTYLGWTEGGVALVLGHRVIWGQYDAEETWVELDGLIGSRFPHALGGKIGVDACALDAGDGVSMHHVTAFATPRTRRKVMAIKGAPGNRPMIERAGSTTKTGARLWIIGVDTVKLQLFGRLAQAGIGADLPIHEELAAELAHVPRDQFLFVTHGEGLAYKPTTLGNWFKDQCKAAGNPLCSAHGLRKSLATLMANAGKSPDEIRAVMAHKTNKEGATYTKKADRSRLADSGFVGLSSTEAERNLSNLSDGLDTSVPQPIERKTKK